MNIFFCNIENASLQFVIFLLKWTWKQDMEMMTVAYAIGDPTSFSRVAISTENKQKKCIVFFGWEFL